MPPPRPSSSRKRRRARRRRCIPARCKYFREGRAVAAREARSGDAPAGSSPCRSDPRQRDRHRPPRRHLPIRRIGTDRRICSGGRDRAPAVLDRRRILRLPDRHRLRHSAGQGFPAAASILAIGWRHWRWPWLRVKIGWDASRGATCAKALLALSCHGGDLVILVRYARRNAEPGAAHACMSGFSACSARWHARAASPPRTRGRRALCCGSSAALASSPGSINGSSTATWSTAPAISLTQDLVVGVVALVTLVRAGLARARAGAADRGGRLPRLLPVRQSPALAAQPSRLRFRAGGRAHGVRHRGHLRHADRGLRHLHLPLHPVRLVHGAGGRHPLLQRDLDRRRSAARAAGRARSASPPRR